MHETVYKLVLSSFRKLVLIYHIPTKPRYYPEKKRNFFRRIIMGVCLTYNMFCRFIKIYNSIILLFVCNYNKPGIAYKPGKSQGL